MERVGIVDAHLSGDLKDLGIVRHGALLAIRHGCASLCFSTNVSRSLTAISTRLDFSPAYFSDGSLTIGSSPMAIHLRTDDLPTPNISAARATSTHSGRAVIAGHLVETRHLLQQERGLAIKCAAQSR